MKKIACILMLLLAISYQLQGQSVERSRPRIGNQWTVSAGFNAINSLGTRGPFNSPSDWAFKNPISVGGEYMWPSGFAIEQSISLNGFSKGDTIDGNIITSDYTYFSTDTAAKYYFGTHLFPGADWLDLFAGTGLGIFVIDKSNVSANLSGGATFWVSDKVGIRIQNVMKFAFNAKDSGFDNNHYQWYLQAILRL